MLVDSASPAEGRVDMPLVSMAATASMENARTASMEMLLLFVMRILVAWFLDGFSRLNVSFAKLLLVLLLPQVEMWPLD